MRWIPLLLIIPLLAGTWGCDEGPAFGFTPNGVFKYQPSDTSLAFSQTDWDVIDPDTSVLVLIHGAQNVGSRDEAISEYWTEAYIEAVTGQDKPSPFADYLVSYYNGTITFPTPSDPSSIDINQGVLKDWCDKNLSDLEAKLTDPALNIVILGSSAGSIIARYLAYTLDASLVDRISTIITVGGLHEGCSACTEFQDLVESNDIAKLVYDVNQGSTIASYLNLQEEDIESLNASLLDPANFPEITFLALAGRSSSAGYAIPSEKDVGYTTLDKYIDFNNHTTIENISAEGLDYFPRMIPGDPFDNGDGDGEIDNDGFIACSSSMGINLFKRLRTTTNNWFPLWTEDSHRSIRQRETLAAAIYGSVITQQDPLH